MANPTAHTRKPVDAPSAWSSATVGDRAAWSLRLSSEMVAEIEDISARIARKCRTLADVDARDVVFPQLAPLVAAVERELIAGRGFVVLGGFPVESLGEDRSAIVCWSIGHILGRPLPQHLNGDRLYRVADERTMDGEVLFTSKTNEAIVWHTDAGYVSSVPDYVGLFTVRAAEIGGMTRLASGHALYNALLRDEPVHLDRLFRPYYYYRSGALEPGEEPVVYVPIFDWECGGITIRYNRQRIERGHAMKGVLLDDADTEALDCLEDFLDTRGLALEFCLAPGDLLVTNNRLILHARGAYTDPSGTASRRRLLYRLWIQRLEAQCHSPERGIT